MNAKPTALYHFCFTEPVVRSTLANANEQRDWRLWKNLAKTIMRNARAHYLRFSRQRCLPINFSVGVHSDRIGKPTLAKARMDFPSLLRKGRYFEEEIHRGLIFLTNHLEIPALTVAMTY